VTITEKNFNEKKNEAWRLVKLLLLYSYNCKACHKSDENDMVAAVAANGQQWMTIHTVEVTRG
jgi:hypothetical protein